jgi:choline dehydrogenase-like flavoprotein
VLGTSSSLVAFPLSAGRSAHSGGAHTRTCAPSARNRTVVDSVGTVKGVSGLRVADASIIPEVPSATTNVTVIMLAERIYQRVYASSSGWLP